MSLIGGYNKSIFRNKRVREMTEEGDLPSARLRRRYGSYGYYHASKLVAKEDTPLNSKFHTPTPVVTNAPSFRGAA